MAHPTTLLGSRRFLPLFVTQFLGAFNDNAFKNAFLIWFTYSVAERTGEDPASMVAIAAGLFILPFFLFSAMAGQLADRHERAWLTRRIKCVEIVLMLAASLGFYLESVPFLLAVLFLLGTQATFFGPIKYSLLPEHLREEELIIGNALIEGGTFLSILLGTIFGGLVIGLPHGAALLSATVIALAVGGWLSSRAIPTAHINDPQLRIGWNIVRETWHVIGFARQEATVWLSIVGISWFWLVGALFLTQLPVYTKDVLHGSAEVVTLLLGTFSVGIGVGSVLCNRLLRGEINGRLVPLGCLGMTLFIVDFYFASTGYTAPVQEGEALGISALLALGFTGIRVILDLFLLALCSGIYIVPLYAIMQHRSEASYISRVIAANNVMNALFMVLASGVTLALFALGLNVIELFLTTGLMNLVVCLGVRKVVRRRLGHA